MSFEEWKDWQEKQAAVRAQAAKEGVKYTLPTANAHGQDDLDVGEYLSILQRLQGVDLNQADFVQSLLQPLTEVPLGYKRGLSVVRYNSGLLQNNLEKLRVLNIICASYAYLSLSVSNDVAAVDVPIVQVTATLIVWWCLDQPLYE